MPYSIFHTLEIVLNVLFMIGLIQYTFPSCCLELLQQVNIFSVLDFHWIVTSYAICIDSSCYFAML